MQNLKIGVHKKKEGFQVSYQHPLTQKRKRKQFKTRKEADNFLSQVIVSNEKGSLKTQNLYLGHLVDLHLQEFPKSILKERMNNFESFYKKFAHFEISDVTKHALLIWFNERREQMDYSERTLCRIKSSLNAFFKWVQEKEFIQHNPLDSIKFKQNVPPKRERQILTGEEIKEVLDKAKKFNPTIFYPYLYAIVQTGARRSEMIKLTWIDVDFKTNFIHLRETKNGESRKISMSNGLRELLLDKQRTSPYVFPNEEGQKLNRAKVQRLVDRFKVIHPIGKNWNYHDLRHSFAYNFLKKGGQMYQLQAILGHKTIQMTVDLYGHLKSQDIEDPSPYNF
jgi:site-specific recombinase XerD